MWSTNLSRKPTIITTGKTLDELNNRIVTRLLDSRVCRIIALMRFGVKPNLLFLDLFQLWFDK